MLFIRLWLDADNCPSAKLMANRGRVVGRMSQGLFRKKALAVGVDYVSGRGGIGRRTLPHIRHLHPLVQRGRAIGAVQGVSDPLFQEVRSPLADCGVAELQARRNGSVAFSASAGKHDLGARAQRCRKRTAPRERLQLRSSRIDGLKRKFGMTFRVALSPWKDSADTYIIYAIWLREHETSWRRTTGRTVLPSYGIAGAVGSHRLRKAGAVEARDAAGCGHPGREAATY